MKLKTLAMTIGLLSTISLHAHATTEGTYRYTRQPLGSLIATNNSPLGGSTLRYMSVDGTGHVVLGLDEMNGEIKPLSPMTVNMPVTMAIGGMKCEGCPWDVTGYAQVTVLRVYPNFTADFTVHYTITNQNGW